MEEIHFTCEKCVYSTNIKQHYNNHLISKKHNRPPIDTNIKKTFTCEICKKLYTSYTGLWRHNRRCKQKVETANVKNALLENINKNKIFIEKATDLIDKLVEKNNYEQNKKEEEEKEKEREREKNTRKNPEYIYLLQEREFVESNRLIYKIGKSKQINASRIRQYPKGSVLLFQKICKNCDLNETELKKLFNEKYIKHSEIGSEYFEGDYNEMIKDIFKFD
jgi:hypothetical protein